MNQHKRRCIGLLVLQLAFNLRAQPILIQPQGLGQTFGGASLSNLRVRNQSADGTETFLLVDFSYDGINGSSARILPVITDKKQTKISGWFGANPASISTGHGTLTLRVKYFNDEPGAPPELTTDHVKVLMFTDVGNAVISQGIFARTIKWGRPNTQPAKAPTVETPFETPKQAQAQADERLRQEVEAKRLAEQAEAQRLADEKLRQEAEAKRLAEQAEAQRLADEKLRQEAEAKRLAEQAEVAKLAEEKARAAVTATQPAPAKSNFALSAKTKTKVTNVDVVNRNIDRTEMTIAVEYQYAKEDGMPKMGVDVASSEEPGASSYFTSPVVDLGRGSRSFVMIPVKFNADAAQSFKRATLPTDKVWIYLADANGAKSYVYQSTMILVWHIPSGGVPAPAAAAHQQNTLDIDSFKQNDLFSGYVTVTYNLATGSSGKLRLKVYDSSKPETAGWFASDDIVIKSGPGVQLLRIAVPKEAPSPDVFEADTIEVQMLDKKDVVTANIKKQSSMSWAKPK